MAQTPQQQAISIANGYLSVAQELITVYERLRSLNDQWTDYNVASLLALMQTIAVNADGSFAAVPDGSPITTNPINPSAYPALLRPVSSLQVSQVKTITDGFLSYVGGQAVSTQVGARAILHAVMGGG